MRSRLALVGLWAVLAASACASSTETPVLPAEEQFALGLQLFEDGQYARAISAFQTFAFNYPQDPRVRSARWLTAESYYRTED